MAMLVCFFHNAHQHLALSLCFSMSRATVSSANSTGLGIDLHAGVLDSSDLAYSFSGNINPSRSLASIRQPGKRFSQHDMVTEPLNVNTEEPSTDCRLTRQATLLESGESDKNGHELKILLGNAQSKLKSGAKISTSSDSRTVEQAIPLERASSQARVDLDIYLENNDCVQGGFLKGQIEVRVRKHSKHKYPILLSSGKFRIIGFESIQNEQERATFYQCSCSLSDVAPGSSRLYTSEPDDEAFARTAEGVYVFPFAYHVPLSPECPKGPLSARSGTSVRYIVMMLVYFIFLTVIELLTVIFLVLSESRTRFLARSLSPTFTVIAMSGPASTLRLSLRQSHLQFRQARPLRSEITRLL